MDFSDLGPSTTTTDSKFDFSDLGPSDKSIGGFGHNLVEDVKGTAKGIGHLAEGLLTEPVDTVKNVVTGLPHALVQEGKRLGGGELLTGHPINAVEQFGQAFYDKPLTTGLDVLPAVGAAGKLMGFGKGAGMASEAAGVAEKVAPIAEDVAKAAPGIAEESANAAQKASVPLGSTFQETVRNLGKKIPGDIKEPLKEVGDYVSKKYGQVAEKPGWSETLAKYLKEHSRNMALKEMGSAPGQVRKIGVPRAHELADYALEKGFVGPEIGTIGREAKVAQGLEQAGGAVGAFRKMASERGAVHNMDEVIDQVRSNLDQKYLTGGIHSSDKGLYLKSLAELKKAGTSAEDVADKVSEMFRESKKLDRLKRPSGPLADVARQVKEINHQKIAQALNPQEMAAYENSLEDYGALTQINEFVKRRASVDAGGRLGPGSGISRAAVQKFLDSVGYRTESKIANRLADYIRKNPGVASKPKDLFRHYIDEAAEAVDEMGDNLH